MSLALEDIEEYHLVTLFWPECTNFKNAGIVGYRFVGGIRLVNTAETVSKVREAVIRSSTRLAGRQSVVLNISDRRLRWILHYDFSFHPYKSKLHNDFWKRVRLPEWRSVGNSWASWTPTLVFFRDWLCLSRPISTCPGMSVNKNVDPGTMSNHAVCSKSCYLIWWGLSAFGITEPHFSEEANCTMTITSARYRAVLRRFVMDADCIDSELQFQQNGVITHSARESIDCVRVMLPGPIISHFGDITWQARSSNFSTPDYFLWEHLISKCTWANLTHLVWKSTSETKLEQLKKAFCSRVWFYHNYRNVLHTRRPLKRCNF